MKENLASGKQQKPKGYKVDFQDDIEGNTSLQTIRTQQEIDLEMPAARVWKSVEKNKLLKAKEELEKIGISQISWENVSLTLGGIFGGATASKLMAGGESNSDVICCTILAVTTVVLFSYGYHKRSEVKNDIMMHVERIKLYLGFDEEEADKKS